MILFEIESVVRMPARRQSLARHDNRAHAPFTSAFLDHLVDFKRGFRGSNELPLWDYILKSDYGLRDRKKIRLLDIGSADGEWLGKVMDLFGSSEYKCTFDSIEPIKQRGTLKRLGQRPIKVHAQDIEYFESENKYDVVNCTHAAYYFWDQGRAHFNIANALNEDGVLVVTLVSDHCVLNDITRFLVSHKWQAPLTAEQYLRMLTKIPVFELDKLTKWRGDFDVDVYLGNNPIL